MGDVLRWNTGILVSILRIDTLFGFRLINKVLVFLN